MKVVVEGSNLRKITKRLGPLKSERWEEERFRWEHHSAGDSPGTYEEVVSGLELACEVSGERIFVRAMIRSRPFILGDAQTNENKSTQFSVLSVAGLEVRGKITYTPEP